MITQSYQTMTEYGINTSADFFSYTTTIVPLFPAMILFAFFIVSLITSYLASKAVSGRGHFIASLATSSTVTTLLAIFMSLIPGFVPQSTVVISFSITIITIIMLLLTKD